MGNRLSKIYTRTGDDGTTGIAANHRLSKDSLRIEALGTLDELNSAIGLTIVQTLPTEITLCLREIQQDLFHMGGELCPPHRIVMTSSQVIALENKLDEWNKLLPPLKEFILPGGNSASAHCHLARTICRRAERRLVSLHRLEPLNPDTLCYINRLSDLLFVIARVLAPDNEILWENLR